MRVFAPAFFSKPPLIPPTRRSCKGGCDNCRRKAGNLEAGHDELLPGADRGAADGEGAGGGRRARGKGARKERARKGKGKGRRARGAEGADGEAGAAGVRLSCVCAVLLFGLRFHRLSSMCSQLFFRLAEPVTLTQLYYARVSLVPLSYPRVSQLTPG